MKFVIVLVAVLVLVWLLLGGRSRAARGPARPTPPASKGAARAPEGMLACSLCGVHLPESEALRLGTRVFCSAAHRDAAARTPGA